MVLPLLGVAGGGPHEGHDVLAVGCEVDALCSVYDTRTSASRTTSAVCRPRRHRPSPYTRPRRCGYPTSRRTARARCATTSGTYRRCSRFATCRRSRERPARTSGMSPTRRTHRPASVRPARTRGVARRLASAGTAPAFPPAAPCRSVQRHGPDIGSGAHLLLERQPFPVGREGERKLLVLALRQRLRLARSVGTGHRQARAPGPKHDGWPSGLQTGDRPSQKVTRVMVSRCES